MTLPTFSKSPTGIHTITHSYQPGDSCSRHPHAGVSICSAHTHTCRHMHARTFTHSVCVHVHALTHVRHLSSVCSVCVYAWPRCPGGLCACTFPRHWGRGGSLCPLVLYMCVCVPDTGAGRGGGRNMCMCLGHLSSACVTQTEHPHTPTCHRPRCARAASWS